MSTKHNRQFGRFITRLIQGENLSREESKAAFYTILNEETTEMQQGAFLAALTAKGETAEEVAGAWEAIYDLDTVKAVLHNGTPVVENSGTGMDSFKTFNISTAASLVAAAGGVKLARHGSRAITSSCGTVDMAEALGVDVECQPETVVKSIEQAGIGLFNGMSPKVHPKALGRILSNIYFGSTLNIAASLANPAFPKHAVRGVYAKERVQPVVEVMKEIGYQRALVIFGGIDNSHLGMDEASVCGTTYGAKLKENGEIDYFTLNPHQFGIDCHSPEALKPLADLTAEVKAFVSLLQGKSKSPRKDAVSLNAGLIFYIAGVSDTMEEGVQKAANLLEQGRAYEQLENWVSVQSSTPENSLKKLRLLSGE